jgi:DNA-directed RNA polymerase III subunit RPC4
MTASGPFAMGPSLAGSSGRRFTPRSNFVAATPAGPSEHLGAGLTKTTAPSLKKEKEENILTSENAHANEDAEVYSEPDDGVEIIDMDNVRTMDWMAPETLQRGLDTKKRKKDVKLKKEETSPKKNLSSLPDMDHQHTVGEDINLANAVDLSESEEEEELEDIIDDFSLNVEQDVVCGCSKSLILRHTLNTHRVRTFVKNDYSSSNFLLLFLSLPPRLASHQQPTRAKERQ